MRQHDGGNLDPLLILGTMEDPHVARVFDKLVEWGAQAHVVDYLAGTAVTWQADSTGKAQLHVAGHRIRSPCWVWDRVKIIVGTPFHLAGEPSSAGFAAHECRALYTLLDDLVAGEVTEAFATMFLDRMSRRRPDVGSRA